MDGMKHVPPRSGDAPTAPTPKRNCVMCGGIGYVESGGYEEYSAPRCMCNPEPLKWREAATAPKTGEHILVTRLGERGFGYTGPLVQDFCAVVHYWPLEGEDGFYLSSGASADIDDHPVQFTHWLPLRASSFGEPTAVPTRSDDEAEAPDAERLILDLEVALRDRVNHDTQFAANVKGLIARAQAASHHLLPTLEEIRGIASRASSSGAPSQGPTTANAIDDLIEAFQRACERVVVEGDSRLSMTTKERAVLRNEIRAGLLRAVPASPSGTPRDADLIRAAEMLREEAGTVAYCMRCDQRAAWKSDERKAEMLAAADAIALRSRPASAPLPRAAE